MRLSLALTGISLVALAVPVAAQNFNVDFGNLSDAPAASYGAAGQTGYWNAIGVPSGRIPLRDLDGVLTTVDIRGVGGTQILEFDNPGTSGDDDALVDDMLIGFSDPLDVCLWIDNLENGLYEVTSYALTPDDGGLLSRVRVDFAHEGPIYIGGDWPGAHENGVTYTRHYVEITNNEIAFHAGELGASVQAGLNGVQVRLLSPAATPGSDLGSLIPRIDAVRPNPASGLQTVLFSLPQVMAAVRLEIVDPAGRRVWSRELHDLDAGLTSVDWRRCCCCCCWVTWFGEGGGAARRPRRR